MSGAGRLNKDIYAKQSSKSGIAFHRGDVLYGKLRPYLQNWLLPTFDGLAVGDFWVLQPQNADSSFLYRLIQSRQFDEVANQSTGTKMPRADWKLVSKTVFSIPSNISEQAAIGTYFTALDSLITLHQRKCIFFTGRAGRLISTVNKKRITSSWEQREVGDLLIERSQQAPMSDEYPLMAFIANEGVAPKGERYDRSALVTDTVNKLYKKTEKGDFIYSSNNLETGSIGLNKYGKACISPVYSIFEPTGIADSDFLGRRLVRKDFINAMVKWRQGVIYGQWRIHESDFLKIEISVPSVEEQRKIGAYLDQLDNLITLHQRKCALLFSPFQAFISMMFITSTFSWEQRKFDEVFDCTVPNNTLSRAELSYDEGTVLNVHYGDVLIKYGSVLDVQKDDIPRIPHRCREDFNGALLQDGDVIIADTAEDETTGKACEIGNLQGSAIVSGLHTMVCRPRNRMALGYLGYYLNSNAYHHQLLPLMQGIKVLSLSRSNIQKTSVSYPIAVKEQQLIAYYFSQLDNLITLHQRQPFLQSPPDISLIVQLTPPFYTFSWEQRKLGDMMNVTSVKRIHQSDWTDSGVRFLRARDIVAAAKNEEPDDYLYISKEKYEEYSTLSGKVGVSDLLVTGVGTIGVPYLVRNLEPLYFKDGNIIWFQNSDKIDGKFLFYSFSAEQIQGFINESAGIGTVGTYTIESGKKTPISLPNQIEQAKVGEFFQQLDNLITLHQRQTIVYAVIRSIRKVILAERQYFAPPMVRKSP